MFDEKSGQSNKAEIVLIIMVMK